MNDLNDMLNSLGRMMQDYQTPDYTYSPMDPIRVEVLKEISSSFKKGERLGGLYYYVEFPNGYGIDITKHNGTYGRESDLWEIAVMKDGDCCYDTPITDDVIGWLTDAEALHYAIEVMKLPSAK